jgi:hypothetical protein
LQASTAAALPLLLLLLLLNNAACGSKVTLHGTKLRVVTNYRQR